VSRRLTDLLKPSQSWDGSPPKERFVVDQEESIEVAVGPPDVAESRHALEAIRYICLRLLEIDSGLLVRISELDAKLRLTRDIWALAQAAEVIGVRLPGLRSAADAARPANREHVRFFNRIIALDEPTSELAAVVGYGYPALREALIGHRVRVHSLADEATAACLDVVMERLDGLWREQPSMGADILDVRPDLRALREDLSINNGRSEQATSGCADGPDAVTDFPALAAIPPRPGRDLTLQEDPQGSIVQPSDGYGAVLHDVAFKIELCAAEICAAIVAHHPEAPWGLRYDLAKQVRDEGRHFELLTGRMRELGTSLGEHPIRFDVWDKFTLGRTLPERIMIEQRLGEGIGLDGGLKTYRFMRQIGDHRTALIFDYINADEVTHVGNGNHWLKTLLGGDAEMARVETEVRQMLAGRGMGVRYVNPINVDDRRLSGFTSAELEELQAEWERERQRSAQSHRTKQAPESA
jgi:uncharacterized ferritin-like protein (DUF455 family)